jgi:hypothetical protein
MGWRAKSSATPLLPKSVGSCCTSFPTFALAGKILKDDSSSLATSSLRSTFSRSWMVCESSLLRSAMNARTQPAVGARLSSSAFHEYKTSSAVNS